MIRHMFRVGDKVYPIAASHGWSEVEKGDIGVVSQVDNTIIKVDFPNHRGWNAQPEDLVMCRPDLIHYQWCLELHYPGSNFLLYNLHNHNLIYMSYFHHNDNYHKSRFDHVYWSNQVMVLQMVQIVKYFMRN